MTFRASQLAFAAHLRDPHTQPAPTGVSAERIAVYRDLFFNNIHSFMRNAFPVCRKVIGDAAMKRLVRAWYAQHRAHTPLFPQLPREFVAWLAMAPEAAAELPPWLYELAAYEWLETELDLAPDEVDVAGANPDGDLLGGVPVLSPVARPMQFTWPVHLLGPKFTPDAPPAQPTTLLVYRDRSDTVRFMETNLVTHHLLLLIEVNDGRTGDELLEAISQALPHADPDAVRRAGSETLELLRKADVLSGARTRS